MQWKVYLSGEIHTDWRDKIKQGIELAGLPIECFSANTDHESSDAAGDVLRTNDMPFWRDHQSSKVNGMRTKTLINECHIGVVRFGDKYRQWNAAFDAGMLSALGKPFITLHDEALIHPLKEVDAAAAAWAETPEQVVELLKYMVSE
jgi:YtoQ family protein